MEIGSYCTELNNRIYQNENNVKSKYMTLEEQSFYLSVAQLICEVSIIWCIICFVNGRMEYKRGYKDAKEGKEPKYK